MKFRRWKGNLLPHDWSCIHQPGDEKNGVDSKKRKKHQHSQNSDEIQKYNNGNLYEYVSIQGKYMYEIEETVNLDQDQGHEQKQHNQTHKE